MIFYSLEEKHENLDFQLRKLKERLQQYQIKKAQPWLLSTSSSEPLSKRQKMNDEEDILFDTPILDIIPQEEPPSHITKVAPTNLIFIRFITVPEPILN